MQVGRVELGSPYQPLPIEDGQPLAVIRADKAFGAQFLKHPIDMDDGEAGRVGQDGLGEEPREAGLITQADLLQSQRLLAK